MEDPTLLGLFFRFLGYAVLFHFAFRWRAEESHRPGIVKSALFAAARVGLGALLMLGIGASESAWRHVVVPHHEDLIFAARILAWCLLLWFACGRKLLPLAAVLFAAMIFHLIADFLFPASLFHGFYLFV